MIRLEQREHFIHMMVSEITVSGGNYGWQIDQESGAERT